MLTVHRHAAHVKEHLVLTKQREEKLENITATAEHDFEWLKKGIKGG